MELYENSSSDRIQQLNSEFVNLEYDPEEDMASFLTRVSNLRAKLKELNEDIKESLAMTTILKKLPSSYALFRRKLASNSDSRYNDGHSGK